jgi:hypothetical protein
MHKWIISLEVGVSRNCGEVQDDEHLLSSVEKWGGDVIKWTFPQSSSE